MDDARRAFEDARGSRAWFALGTSGLGSRMVRAARIAAALHEEVGRVEGVSVEERLALLEGVFVEGGS